MLLKMTSRQVPTSERMAAHSSGCPESARARMAAFVATDSTRFSMILRRVFLPSRMASGIFRTSLDIKVMWLVSMATAEPDIPIEMPTSAVNSAGASFIPSPTITVGPSFPLRSFRILTLSSGRSSAWTTPRAFPNCSNQRKNRK